MMSISGTTNNSQTGTLRYGEALQKSFLFYEAQRSGKLPTNNRIEWRGDSALKDGSDKGIDLTGGYYDAGDHVKFGLPMAATMTMLSWGVVQYRDAYTKSGQLDEAMSAIKWGTDYLIKSHKTEGGRTKEFWAQVGDAVIDHKSMDTPEKMTGSRPSFKIDPNNPGTDLAAQTAASLAAASIVFRATDSKYADTLLTNAKQLFSFAETHLGKYSDSVPQAANYYNSGNSFYDELAWGAAWLKKATNDNTYLTKAENYYQTLSNRGWSLGQWTHTWSDNEYGTAVILSQMTNKAQYKTSVEGWLNGWVNGTIPKYTPGGLAHISQWGSLKNSASASFLALVYGDTVNNNGSSYSNFAKGQIDYMLGKNPSNFSYMVGFGDKSPQRAHHRASFDGSWSTFNNQSPNRHILYGALVGGPTAPNDYAYTDERPNYQANEPSTWGNAALTGALAALYSDFGGEALSDTQLNALPGIKVTPDKVSPQPPSSQIVGTEANDTLIGGNADDSIFGKGGNDRLDGYLGNDVLRGGDGNDILSGHAGNDTLFGDAGNDRLWGYDGNDSLIGGKGQDSLSGGGGRDSYYLTDTVTGEFDKIVEFNITQDKILLSKLEFGLNQSLGTLDSNQFRLGSSAVTASDRFIYNQQTGNLFFDADGTGRIAAVQIATFYDKAALSYNNIQVVA
jgi:endoglucanase